MADFRRNFAALLAATAANILMLLGMALVSRGPNLVEVSPTPIDVYLIRTAPNLPSIVHHARESQRAPRPTTQADNQVVASTPPASPQVRSSEQVRAPTLDPARLQSILRSRSTCLTGHRLTIEERERCADLLGPSHDEIAVPQIVGGAKQEVFDQQAGRRAAISAYKRSSSMDDYPGLRSTFLGTKPLPNEAQGPPGSFMVRR